MSPAGLLHPLQLSDRIWMDISMDFIESLPSSRGHTIILVVVDHLSKYTHFIYLTHPYIATSVAKAFMSHVVRLQGIPRSIVWNRDKVLQVTFGELFFNYKAVNYV